jgi:cytochrome c peroxidase
MKGISKRAFGKCGRKRVAVTASMVVFASAALVFSAAAGDSTPNLLAFANSSGVLRTFSTTGGIELTNPFFASLGSNGRACASCHQQSDAWSVSAEHIRARFESSDGLDPIFRPVDGANCPNADVSTTEARRQAYSLLMDKGLIRISRPIPDSADFTLVSVDDPYNCATATDLSLYRRPLPSTNLRFLTTVMWDGRESHAGNTLVQNLTTQAVDATLGHAQGDQAPPADQLQAIVNFEMALSTAQAQANGAGALDSRGATGGPTALSQEPFHVGINDVLGADPTGKPFDPASMTLFASWASDSQGSPGADRRGAIARGETLFNSLPIPITGVKGLNDKLGIATLQGTCTTCHDAPNVGDHSVAFPIDIGIAAPERRTPDMPLYTFLCTATGKTVQTTDPGRALSTGKCDDIGKFKGPILRGLAARAPYFHNGSAATLADVVDFYSTRFNLNLTAQQKSDLVAFLNAL